MPSSFRPAYILVARRPSTGLTQVLRNAILIAGIGAVALGLLWLAGEFMLARTLAGHGISAYYDAATDSMHAARPVNAAIFLIAALLVLAAGLPRRRKLDLVSHANSRSGAPRPHHHEAVGVGR